MGQKVAVRPGIVAILVGLIVAAGVGVFAASRVMHAPVGVMNVVLLLFAALFAATVLSGILGATGVVKTATQQFGGAAAIFLAVFGALVAAALQLQPRPDAAPRVHLHVVGLRDGEVARVSLSGGCSEQATGPEGRVTMTIPDTCGSKDLLDFSVSVNGVGHGEHPIPRAGLSDGMQVELPWKRGEHAISGTVTLDGHPAKEGRVELLGCSTAPVDLDANSSAFVLPVPEDCVVDSYVVNFHIGALDIRREGVQLGRNDFQLESSTPVPTNGSASSSSAASPGTPHEPWGLDRLRTPRGPCKKVTHRAVKSALTTKLFVACTCKDGNTPEEKQLAVYDQSLPSNDELASRLVEIADEWRADCGVH